MQCHATESAARELNLKFLESCHEYESERGAWNLSNNPFGFRKTKAGLGRSREPKPVVAKP
jgi:hypothetical protein